MPMGKELIRTNRKKSERFEPFSQIWVHISKRCENRNPGRRKRHEKEMGTNHEKRHAGNGHRSDERLKRAGRSGWIVFEKKSVHAHPAVLANQAGLSSKKTVRPRQPDLKASITVSVEKERPEPPVTCFHLHPVFIVRNIGTETAKNFHVKFKWGTQGCYQRTAPSTWEELTPSIEPEDQRTWGPTNPPMEFVCCVMKNAIGHALLSVLADSHNSIEERSESNNKAEKYLVLHRRMKD